MSKFQNNFPEMFLKMPSIKIAQTIQLGWLKMSPELKIEIAHLPGLRWAILGPRPLLFQCIGQHEILVLITNVQNPRADYPAVIEVLIFVWAFIYIHNLYTSSEGSDESVHVCVW